MLRAIARHVKADGRADFQDLFDDRGNLRNPRTLSDDAAMHVAERNLTAGDGHVDTIIKVKLREHAKHVELGARYFGLLRDQLRVSGDLDKEIEARLKRARARIEPPAQAT